MRGVVEVHRRPMNRLLVVIVSNVLGIPIGLAINDFSQPLAYRGLVGASAIAAVIAVTAWIGTFSVGTPLRRRSPWLYLSPAATMAVEQSRTTHAALESLDACKLFVVQLIDALNGADRETAVRQRNMSLGPRLLSLHNLHHYHSLMAEARREIEQGTYAAFARRKLDAIDRHEHSDRKLGQAMAS